MCLGTALADFTSALIDSAMSRIPPSDDALKPRLPYLGSVDKNINLIRQCSQVFDALNQTEALQKTSLPLFWHPDFHMRNIFVQDEDPTQVTGIIDWQSAGISPAFMYALETPDFAEELPYDEALDGHAEDPDGSIKGARADAERCGIAYAVCAKITPKLDAAKDLDPIMARSFLFCDSTWRNGAAMLQDELHTLSKSWQELGLPGTCPYEMDEDEVSEHKKLFEDFETSQRLRSYLTRKFHGSSDGWVPSAEYDESKAKLETLLQSWLDVSSSEEDGMTLEKARALWPWNGR